MFYVCIFTTICTFIFMAYSCNVLYNCKIHNQNKNSRAHFGAREAEFIKEISENR
jgi:hypothetical protein